MVKILGLPTYLTGLLTGLRVCCGEEEFGFGSGDGRLEVLPFDGR